MGALVQNLDTSLGIDGTGSPTAGAFLPIEIEYNASSVDKTVFVATRAYYVKAIIGRVTVAGSDGGAVTAVVRKVASGTAITSGTALHSGTFNLKGTADTNQTLTVTAADSLIPAGTSIAIDFTGTLTAATGTLTVALTVA